MAKTVELVKNQSSYPQVKGKVPMMKKKRKFHHGTVAIAMSAMIALGAATYWSSENERGISRVDALAQEHGIIRIVDREGNLLNEYDCQDITFAVRRNKMNPSLVDVCALCKDGLDQDGVMVDAFTGEEIMSEFNTLETVISWDQYCQKLEEQKMPLSFVGFRVKRELGIPPRYIYERMPLRMSYKPEIFSEVETVKQSDVNKKI